MTRQDEMTWERFCSLLTVDAAEEVRSFLQRELDKFKASRAARSGNSRQTTATTYRPQRSGQR
jgi:uncharacterized small protein (DUF1192 family)